MKPCKHLMDISPYPPLCDNPTYYYGGGPIKAHCEGCKGYATDPRETNVTLLKMDVELDSVTATYRCNGCNETFGHVARNRPKYCPTCGAKVHSILRKVD